MPRPETNPPVDRAHRLKNALATEETSIEGRDLYFVLGKEPIIPRDDHRHVSIFRLARPQVLNFLAHFHLAQPTDASRCGALLSDFVRETREALLQIYPGDLVDGIMLQRAINGFTDRHPVFLKAKLLLAPERRRFAGIIIDIFLDHFLTHKWRNFSRGPLPKFIDGVYQFLERRKEWMTPELMRIIPRLKEEDWLGTYGTMGGLALTLRRISNRRAFLTPLIGGEDDLDAPYHSFGKAFREFYPEILESCAN